GDRLLGTARKILRDPDAAEDAVQECVIVAWRTLPTLRDADRFDAWLYKILVSCCYAEARRVQRFAAYVRQLRVDQNNSDEVEQIAERELLDHAFAALTPAHRAVIVLHHYAQFPLTEVASILGVTPGTARSRLHYGLRAMRAAIEAGDRPIIREIPQ
ncbi:MAG: sigma-70 family RNA polymerase sigma factor, partial [Chloroflexi bacterium]|nr:sigma-70 family RNA polymerase sigma factor [Chloroflexota bacterium]